MPSAKETVEALRNLEQEAEDLLVQISTAPERISQQSLHRLDACASAAARIAYGSADVELLSEQMSALITWTDHLDDPLWVERFEQALKKRPLVSPWKK